MKTWIVGISLLLLFGLCAPAAAQNENSLKVGLFVVLSGPYKEFGELVLQSVEYAVEEINSQGGVLGRSVELVIADTEFKAEVAAQRFEELVLEQGITMFALGTGSHIVEALLPLAEERKVLLFSGAVGADNLTGELCSRYFFRTVANTSMRWGALAFWVAMNGYKKVFGIAPDYGFGRTAMATFIQKLQELDPSREIVGEQYHHLGEKDFSPYIRAMIAAGPELVVTPSWGGDLIGLLNQAEELGLKTTYASYFLDVPELLKELKNPDILVGSVGIETYLASIPTEKNRDFIERYHQVFKEYPNSGVGAANLTMKFWAEALEAAGTDDVEAVIDAWEGLIYDGPSGKCYMRPCDHQAQVSMWVGEIVKENPYFAYPFAAEVTTIPVRFFTVPCEQTGCPGLSSK